jgi:26S proteasome regulatory subunit N3
MSDIEMKAEESKDEKQKSDKKDKKEDKKEDKKPVPIPPETEIKNNAILIHRTVSTLEPRFTYRVLRTLTALRRRINAAVLHTAIESIYVKGVHYSLSISNLHSNLSCRLRG